MKKKFKNNFTRLKSDDGEVIEVGNTVYVKKLRKRGKVHAVAADSTLLINIDNTLLEFDFEAVKRVETPVVPIRESPKATEPKIAPGLKLENERLKRELEECERKFSSSSENSVDESSITHKCTVDIVTVHGKKTIRIYSEYEPSLEIKNILRKNGFAWYRFTSKEKANYKSSGYWGAYYSEKRYDFALTFCNQTRNANKEIPLPELSIAPVETIEHKQKQAIISLRTLMESKKRAV